MNSAAKAQNTLQITISSDFRVEFALGKVVPGTEAWMFGEYFPAIRPALNEFGQSQLASFAILATNVTSAVPAMGAMGRWPAVQAFESFLNDPRFVKVRPRRDASMESLSDGHFFPALDHTLEVDTDTDYALVIASDDPLESAPLLRTAFAEDGTNKGYVGKSVAFHPWSDAAEKLLTAAPDGVEVYRIRFNPRQG
ncbi:MAG: hypothetical protein AAF799_25740 [Myxococcota bacterium]